MMSGRVASVCASFTKTTPSFDTSSLKVAPPRRRAGPLADGPRFPRRLLVEVVGAAAAPGGVAPRRRRGDGREARATAKKVAARSRRNAGDLLVEGLAVREDERFEFGRLVLLFCNRGGVQSRAVTSRRR